MRLRIDTIFIGKKSGSFKDLSGSLHMERRDKVKNGEIIVENMIYIKNNAIYKWEIRFNGPEEIQRVPLIDLGNGNWGCCGFITHPLITRTNRIIDKAQKEITATKLEKIYNFILNLFRIKKHEI